MIPSPQRPAKFPLPACEQTHLWVTSARGEEESGKESGNEVEEAPGKWHFIVSGGFAFAARFRARGHAARACVPTYVSLLALKPLPANWWRIQEAKVAGD